jgi:class 3 adenylate cyclase
VLALDVASPPVRFIKTIGDAVMLTSVDPVALLEGVLDLLAADKHGELPQLRIGVASGMAVRRAGDWFGSPVNAGRVMAVARPVWCWLPNPPAMQSVPLPASPGRSRVRGTSRASRERLTCTAPARPMVNSTFVLWWLTSISRRWVCSTALRATRAGTVLT